MTGWVIIVTGVACVGKTTFSSKLAEKLGLEFIDLPELIKEMKLYEYYDQSSGDYVVDLRRVSSRLGSILKGKKSIVASVHLIKPRSVPVKLVIVLRLRPDILMRRLKEKNYPESKIAENITAEIVDKPLHDAVEKFGERKVVQIDVTGIDMNKLVEKTAEAYITSNIKSLNNKIDWISELERIDTHSEILQFLAKYG